MQRNEKQLRFRRGSVLIVAMVVVFALASMVLTLGRSTRVEAGASANAVSALQADAILRGAEQYVMALVVEQRDVLGTLDESHFAAVPVGNGYFWLLRPDFDDASLPLFGIVDESSKLNLNAASYETLRKLPGMTDEIAASIVDWRDDDDTPTESGAETPQYLSGSTPYAAKNANFETVEELLLVRGVTRELLYGRSDAGRGTFSVDRYVTAGLIDYFTVWSRENNTAADGTRRINVNDQRSRNALRTLLSDRLGEARSNEIMARIAPPAFRDVFDFAERTGLEYEEFELIEDYITGIDPRGSLRGRVNVNTAPREVLLCVGDLTESDVDALLARRLGQSRSGLKSRAWVWDALGERAIGLGNLITAQGGQFSADILAVSGDGRAFRRVRIVIDARVSPAAVVYRRDLSDRPWPLDPKIRESLRSGVGLVRGDDRLRTTRSTP